MKRLSLILILTLTLALGGCSEYIEVDEKSFVIAIGMDKAENGLMKVSFLFTSPESGGGDSSTEPPEKDLLTVEAPTIYSALRLINTFRSKKIDISHTLLIVFSQEIAQEGIINYLTDFVNTRAFRPSIYLAVALNDAGEFLSSIEPKQDIFIEKYINRLFSKVTTNAVNTGYLYYNYFTYLEEAGNLIPLVGVSSTESVAPAEDEFKAVIPDDFSINYVADRVPIDKEEAAIMCGYAVFDKERMVGTLGISESELAKMATKNLPPSDFSVYYPEKEKYITVNLRQISTPAIKVRTGDVPEIDIKINLLGEFTGIEGAFNTEEECKAFTEYLNKCMTEKMTALLKRSQSEFDADIVGFGEHAKLNFLTNKQWEKYNWPEKYKAAIIRPVVMVEINDYGELKYVPKEN